MSFLVRAWMVSVVVGKCFPIQVSFLAGVHSSPYVVGFVSLIGSILNVPGFVSFLDSGGSGGVVLIKLPIATR